MCEFKNYFNTLILFTLMYFFSHEHSYNVLNFQRINVNYILTLIIMIV